ncbi:Elongation-Factor P (EF-P) rhamnosyltransferase EarP [Burkholderiales bacterium]
MNRDNQAIVFCHVVDHYGDAGVCLRLAKGLAARGCETTVVIDQVALLDQMQPNLPPGVHVSIQPPNLDESAVPDLVIEAFQHEAPLEFRLTLERAYSLGARTRRVCLDYLATEPWASDCQGLKSPDQAVRRALNPQGGMAVNPKGPAAQRIWLAPSFSARGPGLIRGTWSDATESQRRAMRAQLGAGDSTFLVMGFGYADAPWSLLQRAFERHGLPAGFERAMLYRPQGLSLTHDEFDLALQACDLNFVRGEDSFVRAHWAAASPWRVPFVWQPYRQEGLAHRDKLEGWLDQIFRPSHAMVHLEAMHFVFNGMAEHPSISACWKGMLADWAPMRDHLQDACRGLAEQPALETRLLALLDERAESARI